MTIARRVTRWLQNPDALALSQQADVERTVQALREKRALHDTLVANGMDTNVAWQLIWMMHKDEHEERLR